MRKMSQVLIEQVSNGFAVTQEDKVAVFTDLDDMISFVTTLYMDKEE